MSDVYVEAMSLIDLGAQARGNVVLGVKIGETHLSFEIGPECAGAAFTFLIVGVMEGVRYTGAKAVLTLPSGQTLSADPGDDLGVTVVDNGKESHHPTWAEALMSVYTP